MKYTLLKKEGNHVTKTEFTSQEKKEIRLAGVHMCWENCAHACDCKKILASTNVPFTEYDFITSGSQIFNNDGVVLEGIVTKCQNYEEKKYKRLSIEEIKKINELKKAMLMNFYNAETFEEALATQEELQRRELIREQAYIKSKKKHN